MAINLRAYFAGCRFAIPHMVRGGGGAIVNTASGPAFVGDIARVAYGTSKGGVVSLHKYVATQPATEGIRCNAIAAGLINTPVIAHSGEKKLAPLMKESLSPAVAPHGREARCGKEGGRAMKI